MMFIKLFIKLFTLVSKMAMVLYCIVNLVERFPLLFGFIGLIIYAILERVLI